jgi:DNA-binding Xre family transcriptional regulator
MLRKKRGTLQPHNSSIVLHLKPILAARNILHPSAFLIKIGINNSTANKMLKGEAVQVNFRQLTTLCMTLNCTPNDLFALRDLTPPAGHQLEKLQKLEDAIINPMDGFATMGLQELKDRRKES